MPVLAAPAIAAGTLSALDQPHLSAGGGTLLRCWQESDAGDVAEAYQDEEIQKWHVRRADSVAEALGWVIAWRDEWRQEIGAAWAVVDEDSDLLLGRAALKGWSLADGTAHVAYWTTPAARGRGVCSRAVNAMVTWAFATGFHRLSLEHAVANAGSCRIAAKTGFELEGVQRSAWLQADGRHDAHVHARLRPQ